MSDKIRKEFEEWCLLEPEVMEYSEGLKTYLNGEVCLLWSSWQAAYKASRHEELVEALFKLSYPSGVETIEKAERLKAQELLKSMEK